MKLIEEKLVEAVIQIIVNSIHPNITFTQINQVLTELQKLRKDDFPPINVEDVEKDKVVVENYMKNEGLEK